MEELQIASIYSDADLCGILGGSPMGFQMMSGSKAEGTDGHTMFARNMMPEYYENLVFHPEYGILEEIIEGESNAEN